MKKVLCVVGLLCAASFSQVNAFEKGTSIEQFMKYHKASQEKKGKEFNEKQYKELFAAIDKNADGQLTKAEKSAYWASKKK
ncbi:MAG: hypothetical protein ACSHW0_13735 [Thalassotalea sp.]